MQSSDFLLFFGLIRRAGRLAIGIENAAAACQSSPSTFTAQKYQCRVLWRNSSIPHSPPAAPPKKDSPSSTFSGMRHAPRRAFDLSAP